MSFSVVNHFDQKQFGKNTEEFNPEIFAKVDFIFKNLILKTHHDAYAFTPF